MANITKKVACLLDRGFEDSEFRVPYDRIKAEGCQVDIIGKDAGAELIGDKGKERVKADLGIADVKPEDYDALLIPGGHSPDHLRADRRFVDFVKRFDALHRPLFAICHGPQLMMSAGIVGKGHTLTAWKTVQEDLRYTGATVKDEPAVRDGHWLTSRQPGDLKAFSDAIAQMLGEVQPATRQETRPHVRA
ncbi:MAG: type 1 glutamine amidotransferase [Myxococcaceae bacterium]|nr:type 1 glutamine amidotransferase [Myxococcaceae bacterium]